MKKVKIEITERDIKLGRGSAGDTTRCPVARALKRKLRDKFVRCGCTYFVFAGNHYIDLPKKASQFMYDLFDDARAKVKPFSFTVSLPAA